jgi:hypothetical protein
MGVVLTVCTAIACQPPADDASPNESAGKSDTRDGLRWMLDRAVDKGSAAPSPGPLSSDYIMADHAHYEQTFARTLDNEHPIHRYAVWDFSQSGNRYWRLGVVALSDDSTVPPRTLMTPRVCVILDDDTGACADGTKDDQYHFLGSLPIYATRREAAVLDFSIPSGRSVKWIAVAPKGTTERSTGFGLGDYWLEVEYLAAAEWATCQQPSPESQRMCTNLGE